MTIFCGLYYVCPKTHQKTQVPLYLRKLDGEFHDYEYNITETHRYLYRGTDVLETEFTFPNTETIIYNFRYQIEDGDWVEMTVEPKAKAEEKYQMAVDAGHQAFLAKENTQKGIYTVKIGRLEPNQLVSIQFSYYSYYQITPNSLNTKIQLTKIPSYHRMGDRPDVDQPKLVDGTQLDYGIYFTGKFYRTSPKFKVSFYGDLESQFETTSGVVEIEKINLSGTKDLGFRIVPEEKIKSSVSGWVNPENNEKYLQIVWANYMGQNKELTNDDWEIVGFNEPTPETQEQEYQHRVTIIVDGSGSMWGERIENARQATLLALQDMPENYQLSLGVFGSTYLFCPSASKLTSGVSYDYTGTQKPSNPLREGCHESTYCDVCQINPIPGDKYASTSVPDYDLCSQCYSRLKAGTEICEHDPNDFEKVSPAPRTLDFELLDYHNFWRDYTPESLQFFRTFVEKCITHSYGGTEMLNVLQEAYARFNATSDPSKKYHNTIVFLTDGGVSGNQQQEIIHLIKKNANNTTFFTLGVGSGTDCQFLSTMAKAGNGLSVQITNPEEIGDQVQMIIKCLSNPNLRNIGFRWSGAKVEEASIKPSSVLFHNEPYVLLAKVQEEDEGDATVTLTVPYGEKELDILTLNLNEIEESNFPLDRAFASAYIKKLVEYPESEPSLNKGQRVEKITELGCKYGLVTPFTSAVAVEYQENADGTRVPKKVQIPIGAPDQTLTTEPEQNYLHSALGGAYHIGINTLGNTSLQLRSQPPNPRQYVSPWLSCGAPSAMACAPAPAPSPSYSMEYDDGCEEDDDMDFDLFGSGGGSNTTVKESVPARCFGLEERGATLQSVSKTKSHLGKHGHSKTFVQETLSDGTTPEYVEPTVPILTCLRQLVLLKEDNNTWELTPEVLKYLGMSNEYAEQLMSQMTNVEESLRPTYLVIAFFHNHLDLSYVWSGVYNKVVNTHFKSRQNTLEEELLKQAQMITC